MVQLQALNGKMAGQQWVARHFPVQLGRARTCDVALDEPGVWDKHAEITRTDETFAFSVHPPALATINRETVQPQRSLRNGDVIELGSARLRFSLSPTRHRNMLVREILTWVGLAVLCVLQAALMYSLT
jgi:predicted component of type VI protein secretion system